MTPKVTGMFLDGLGGVEGGAEGVWMDACRQIGMEGYNTGCNAITSAGAVELYVLPNSCPIEIFNKLPVCRKPLVNCLGVAIKRWNKSNLYI